MRPTTILLLLLVLILIVGCKTTDTGVRTDFSGIETGITGAQASNTKAATTVATVVKTGAAANAPVLLRLQSQINDTQADLLTTQTALDTAKKENVAQADADATKIADQQKQIASFSPKLRNWAILTAIAFIIAAGLAIAAPLIVSSTGTGAVINAVPVIGSIAGTGERVIVAAIGFILIISVEGLGKLFGFL